MSVNILPSDSFLDPLKLIEDAKDHLKCKFCFQLIQEPILSLKCSHLFCKACVHKNPSCPWCQIKFNPEDVLEETHLSDILTELSQLENLLLNPQLEGEENLQDDQEDACTTLSPHTMAFPLSPQKNAAENGIEAKDEGMQDNEVSGSTKNPATPISCKLPSASSLTTPKPDNSVVAHKRSLFPNSPAFPPLPRTPLSEKPVQDNCGTATPSNLLKETGPKKRKLLSKSPGLELKKNPKGETILHRAAIKGDLKLLAEHLTDDVDVDVRDNAGWTPLHEACNHNNLEAARLLLDRGASVSIPGLDKETPLHDAVVRDSVDIVKLLVERGADVTARNSRGLVPSDLTVNPEILKILEEARTNARSAPEVLPKGPPCKPMVILSSGIDSTQKQQLEAFAHVVKAVVVQEFNDQVTHLVTGGASRGVCQRTLKYLHAVLTGKWVLSFQWVLLCMECGRHVDETPFEVMGTRQQPTSEGPSRARLNYQNQHPPLFEGATFYFHGKFAAPAPLLESLTALVKCGGGSISSRHKALDEEKTLYHAQNLPELSGITHFIVYQEKTPSLPNPGPHAVRVSVFWLLDCMDAFQFLPLSHNNP